LSADVIIKIAIIMTVLHVKPPYDDDDDDDDDEGDNPMMVG